MRKPRILAVLLSLLALSAVGLPQYARGDTNRPAADNAIAAELIGQVTNPTPRLSTQYGYLSFLTGVDPTTIATGDVSEQTALLTFYSDTVTQRVINNGPMRVIDRVGTLGLYLDPAVNGDFSRPVTFQDGDQLLGGELRHQVVIDTLTGAFTANFDVTITWTKRFSLSGTEYQLGKAGDHFAITFFGHLNQQPPPAAYIAGFARGLEVRR